MSNDEKKTSKKRAGRKRLPPLQPGPALQFVVANHPDEFRTDNTMRHIRSHVMYQHRGERQGGSRSPPDRGSRSRLKSVTRTPSPMTTRSADMLDASGLEGSGYLAPPTTRRSTTWDSEFYRLMSQAPVADPMRNLATRIIAATTADPARSAPPMFEQSSEYPFPSSSSALGEESLDDLKALYINSNEFCRDRAWMEAVCSTRMSFLSNVSANCVFQDFSEGFLEDTPMTTYAKTKVLPMIKDSLQETSTSSADFTALSILHILVSEVGGFDEDVLDGHQEALVRIVNRRGGLRDLGTDDRISTFLAVIFLACTVLRGRNEPAMLHGFIPSQRPSALAERPPPLSPLFAPHGSLIGLYGSCADGTYDILCDMLKLTRLFILRWNYVSDVFPPYSTPEVASYEGQMDQIYADLLRRPSTDADFAPDWIYESVRLASLIYCRSIVQGVPLTDATNVMHARSSGMVLPGTTLITALYDALNQTDKNSHWGSLYGVLLWICLVGGAASWSSVPQSLYGAHNEAHTATAWARKFFALFTVKSSLTGGYGHAAATIEAQRTMLQVQHLLNLKRELLHQ